MNREDVEKLSTAAKGKINLLNSNFGKYFMRAIMAGFFIDVAMIYSNVVGNVFSKTFPEWGKFLGALVFSIAVLLIVMVGGELFTGNNLVMAFGAYDKSVSRKVICCTGRSGTNKDQSQDQASHKVADVTDSPDLAHVFP